MHLSFLIALVGLASAHSPPSSLTPISKITGPVVQGSYIIELKQSASRSSHLSRLPSGTTGSSITHYYDQAFGGYAALLDTKALEYLRRLSDVEAIYEDGIVQLEAQSRTTPTTRSFTSASHDSSLFKRTNGSSVDIYDIGTDIYTQHSQFGGRAVWGATFGGYPSADGNGASTYYASLAAGSTYGFATQAKLIAVKAISDAGSGSTADIISAINWVITAAQASGRPSIAMTALGGSASSALDAAVSNAISKGIHFVVAAGNSNTDAGTISPARVAAAVTVGAVDASGKRASFSNYGSVVDIYYYGVSTIGAWIGSTTATKTISGTGVAMAKVVGILAFAIDNHGNKSPAALTADLISHAQNVGGVLIAAPW